MIVDERLLRIECLRRALEFAEETGVMTGDAVLDLAHRFWRFVEAGAHGEPTAH